MRLAAVVCLAALVSGCGASHRVASCPDCAQAVAAATYYAFSQLDCDGEIDSADQSSRDCSDELENVNRLPKILSVKQVKGGVLVTLTIYLAGGPGGMTQAILVDPNGGIVKATNLGIN